MMEQKLGEIAIKKGLITRDHLREALLVQQSGDAELGVEAGAKVGKILIALGFLEPMVLVRILYEQMGGIDFLLIGDYMVEPRVVSWLPEHEAKRYAVLPLVSMGDESLLIATSRGLNPKEIGELEEMTRRSIEPVPVFDTEIASSIEKCYDTFRRRGISSIRIGEILVRDNYITQKDLNEALDTSIKTQRMLGRILIERGKVNERDFFKFLSLQKKVSMISSQDILPVLDRSLIKGISKAFCLRNLIVPYLREGDKVYVATAEPALDTTELSKVLRCKSVDLKLATYTDIETILRAVYIEKESFESDSVEVDAGDLEDIAIDEELSAAAIEDIGTLNKRYKKITDHILIEGIRKGASDIHIEHYESDVVVRFRVDGILYDMDYLPIDKKSVGGIINVLKVQADMDIAERRMPQSGRFRKKTSGDILYDFRVQTQPTLYGENMVLRVLNQSGSLMNVENLGLLPDVRVRYEKLIRNPAGLILICGPTGSGKTTTLYTTLGELRKDMRKKIVTIEDPIEYSLGRIQQAQVKEEIGYGFAQATRAFLREDPDIMLIGEIRDEATALEAVRASQTGHLVFSTLHTSNTVESIARLVDLGLSSGSIAAELLLVISQRLARRNCSHCSKPHRPSKELLDTFYPGGTPEGLVFHKGHGCDACSYTGHKGRIAILEFWFIDMESKKLILELANFEDLYFGARANGMIPMVKDALMKVETGEISLDSLPDIIPYYEILRWKSEGAGKKLHTVAGGGSS